MTEPVKKKTHELRIVVRFGDPHTQREAVAHASNMLEGRHEFPHGPESLTVVRVTKKS